MLSCRRTWILAWWIVEWTQGFHLEIGKFGSHLNRIFIRRSQLTRPTKKRMKVQPGALLAFPEEYVVLSHIRLLKVFVKQLTGKTYCRTKSILTMFIDVLILEWQRHLIEWYHAKVII